MKVFDNFLHKVTQMIEKCKAKRKQKKLIKTQDEKLIVETLSPQEDNSKIDIKEVVEIMENPEHKVEVVENNFEEIMKQNNVRDTLKHLPDNEILRLLDEHMDKLKKQEKIEPAIKAIANNDKKLKATLENVVNLTDLELARIFETLKPEASEEKNQEIEQRKVRIVSTKILRHMIQHGGAWHLSELTQTMQEKSKLDVLNLCLNTLYNFEKNKGRSLEEKAKEKFVIDLLCLTQIDSKTKLDLVEAYAEDGLLTKGNKDEIKIQMEKERLRKEEYERSKQTGR